ncbi:MAG TPA: hypothetical protein VMV61_08900 [Patescibacteria group bacterium]|nr:hypothetical protein [Patescibacteria group bacterium]
MKRLLSFLAFAFVCAVPSLAQSPSAPAAAGSAASSSAATPLPPADEVLARYVVALGGENALRKINSRIMKGTFEISAQQISGTAELDMQAPDSFFSEVSLSDGSQHILVFDGKTGWSAEPHSGVHRISGLELEQLRRSSHFLYESHLHDLFADIRVVTKVMEADRPVWVLQASPAQGPPEIFYFDVETGLLVRHDSVQATSEGNVPSEHRYLDYITVDGVQVPSLLQHRDPHVAWQVKFTDIRQNVPIDPAKFAKPSAHSAGK